MVTVDRSSSAAGRTREQPLSPGARTRGQSETIGAVLLVALVVVVVSAVGVAGIAWIDTLADDRLTATVGVDGAVEASADEDGETLRLVMIHEGGDPLEPDDVLLLTDERADRQRITLAAATGADTTFRPGDRLPLAEPTFDPDRAVRVTVIHEPTGTVLADSTVTRPQT